jgi:hypothetical protein
MFNMFIQEERSRVVTKALRNERHENHKIALAYHPLRLVFTEKIVREISQLFNNRIIKTRIKIYSETRDAYFV